MNKKYKPIIAVAVLVILVAILGIVTHVVMKYIPSSEKMDLNEYYGEMADGEIAWSLELRNWKNVVWWTETESIYHWMW